MKFENIKAVVTTALQTISNKIINALKAAFKPRQLTPDKYQRIEALTKLFIMLVLFTSGYSLLMSVNAVLSQYLLSANLLVTANYLLFKLK